MVSEDAKKQKTTLFCFEHFRYKKGDIAARTASEPSVTREGRARFCLPSTNLRTYPISPETRQ
jgi:hypothetical protein